MCLECIFEKLLNIICCFVFIFILFLIAYNYAIVYLF